VNNRSSVLCFDPTCRFVNGRVFSYGPCQLTRTKDFSKVPFEKETLRTTPPCSPYFEGSPPSPPDFPLCRVFFSGLKAGIYPLPVFFFLEGPFGIDMTFFPCLFAIAFGLCRSPLLCGAFPPPRSLIKTSHGCRALHFSPPSLPSSIPSGHFHFSYRFSTLLISCYPVSGLRARSQNR